MLIQNPHQNFTYPLKKGLNLLGRKSENNECEIQLNDAYVSRQHAAITLVEKEGKIFIFIEDIDSRNGTFNRKKKPIKKNLKYPFTKNDYYIVGLTKLSLKLD